MHARVLQEEVKEDTVESIMELADRTNAWQLRAVCRHFLRNRGDLGFGGNGQNDDDAMGGNPDP